MIKHAQLILVDGADAYAVRCSGCGPGTQVGLHPEATISRSRELREFEDRAARWRWRRRCRLFYDRLGRTGSGLSGSSKEPVPQQDSDRRGDRIAAAGGQCRAAQCRAAPLSDECDSLPRRRSIHIPAGSTRVPRRLGGGAPTVEWSPGSLRIAELAKRGAKARYDDVTSSRQPSARTDSQL